MVLREIGEKKIVIAFKNNIHVDLNLDPLGSRIFISIPRVRRKLLQIPFNIVLDPGGSGSSKSNLAIKIYPVLLVQIFS